MQIHKRVLHWLAAVALLLSGFAWWASPASAVEGPDLTVSLLRKGTDYLLGVELKREYRIVVTNVGTAPTSGTVTAKVDLPLGLIFTSTSGTGWNCSSFKDTCTRSDALAPGASYPPITMTVKVDLSSSKASASVSGGGDVNSANNSTNNDVTSHDLPQIRVDTTGNESWARTASVTVDVVKPELGFELNPHLFQYIWSQSSTPPAAGWTAFADGQTLTLSGKNGEWYLHLRAGDVIGNIVRLSTERFRLDNTAPTATFTQWKANGQLHTPRMPTNGDVSVTPTVIEAGDVPYTMKWAADVQDIAYFATGGTPFADSFAVSENGDYTVYMKDAAGNEGLQTIRIEGIVRTPPTLTAARDPVEPTRGSVTVYVTGSVYGTEAGNVLGVVKWAEGLKEAAFFEANGYDITNGTSFTVSRNGTYTIYAQDLAGNVVLTSTEIANINTETPGVSVSIEPGTPTRGNVAVTVTATVYGTDNLLSWMRWGPENGAATDLAFDEILDDGTALLRTYAARATATENGTYVVKVRDAAGNEKTQSVGVGNMFRTPPVIALAAPTEPTTGGVPIMAALQAVGAMNTVKFSFWAPGVWTVEQFDEAEKSEAPTGGFLFTVYENGWYTVFAEDAAGNRQAVPIEIANIVKLPPPETKATTLTFASVEPNGVRVKLTFDRELDASASIEASAFMIHGAPAPVASVHVDELDRRVLWVSLAEDVAVSGWPESASVSILMEAVRTVDGATNEAIDDYYLVTPAAAAALAAGIDIEGDGVEIAELAAYLQNGSNVLDVNKDGKTDKSDVVFLLGLIPTKSFTNVPQ